MYQARILDKDRQLKAVLPGVRWHYTRRINEATSIEIHIPRETIDEVITQDHPLYGFFMPTQPVVVQAKPVRAKPNKAQYAEIAAFIQIYKGDVLKASGKIVGRTLGQVVTVEAYTEEILLEGNLTPAQYGKVWDGWDLADVARDLLDGWQSLRVKAQSQWQERMVDSSNVDLTTDPGLVMLAKKASGQYYDSGHITLLFNKSEILNFKAWDRVRWSADSEEPVKTSIQISTNGTSFSAPFDGGFPEEVGYYIGGDHDQVWVRINLSTSDTESEDENGNKVGVTPTVFALEVIARTEGKLTAGSVPSVAGVTVKGLSADYASALQVLVQACEQTGWEFSVWNGTLNLAEKLGVDRTKNFVLRAGTNIEITALGDDDGEFCNVLTAYSPGRGINRMEITLRDEASIAEYGEYPAAVEFDAEKLDELEQKAQEFLSEHNSPKTQFEIAVAFEHDKEPDYGLGDKVRVADPETGVVTTTRIMAEAREYGESGLVVNLELGKAGFTLAEAISGERRPTKPLDPLQPTGVYARGIIKGIVVGCSAPKTDWAYTECHVSTAKGFVPGSATLVDKGKQTRFDIPNLDPGVRYYARLIHVDTSGRRSEPSREVSAAAQYIPVEALPDYSIGVEKFMEGLKPPIMVTSKPDFPDPRYPIDTILFYTQDGRLYRVVGDDWVPMVVTDFSELNGKLQSNQIALGAIQEDLIAAGAIASRHIQIEAVTAEKIAHEAVQTEHIDTGAITETKISDNAISAPKIKTGAIEADKIAANAVTATKIAANAVTANKIAAGAVETEKLAANAITAGKIAAGAIETNHISAGAVKADQIDANAVTTTKILAGAVTAAKIAADAVTATKIAAEAVTAAKIAAGAITTDKLAANAVTAEKLAAAELIADKIMAGIVAAGGITADYIAAGSIKAQHFQQVPVVDTYNVMDSFDASHPLEIPIYIDEGMSIHDVRITARGMRYRAYASGASAGGSHSHDVEIPDHTHQLGGSLQGADTWPSRTNVSVSNHLPHSHTYDKATKASSALADLTWKSGTHTHTFSGSDTVSISISGSTDMVGGSGWYHSHSFSGSDSDSVSISGTTGSSSQSYVYDLSQGLHEHDIATTSTDTGYVGPTSHVVTDPKHYHTFDYLYPYSVTEEGGGSIPTTTSEGSHQHDLVYGIFDDITANGLPKGVDLWFCDSDDRSNYVKVADLPEPPAGVDEFELCKERKLSAEGSGWKWVKFTTTTKGRISAHIVIRGFQDSWLLEE